MKKNFLPASLLLLMTPAPGSAIETVDQATHTPYTQESRNIAQAMMQKLGATLKGQLESGGAASAIGICKHVAPSLAAEYSKTGWKVSRVSLRARNKTLGTPDAWERAKLEMFEQNKDQTDVTNTQETTEVTKEADGRWFRYMKAIPTQAMCLQCHGQEGEIPADVKAILTWEYPEDQATGYRVGDIRGAISIKYKLQD